MNKLLILDMDGTIRVNGAADFDNLKLTSGFINSPRDQKLIPSAIAAINQAKRQGFSIVGASNQGGVAAGKKSLDDCIAEQEHTLQLLYEADAEIFGIMFCPDYEGNDCYLSDQFLTDKISQPEYKGLYRKPNAGMILHAIDVYQATEVIFVGDRPEDEQAAKNANVQFIWADKWRSSYMMSLIMMSL